MGCEYFRQKDGCTEQHAPSDVSAFRREEALQACLELSPQRTAEWCPGHNAPRILPNSRGMQTLALTSPCVCLGHRHGQFDMKSLSRVRSCFDVLGFQPTVQTLPGDRHALPPCLRRLLGMTLIAFALMFSPCRLHEIPRSQLDLSYNSGTRE